jgi:uncharacterized protein YecT (DUF1311 family)
MTQGAQAVATENQGALYVAALRVKNLKGIKEAEAQLPHGGLIIISGPNGAGKSSFSDAIPWALTGDRGIDPMPVREGAERAEVWLRLEGPGLTTAYEVKKTILDRERIRLSVRAANKKEDEQAPQALLDTFTGDLAFDPVEFGRMSEAKRRAIFEKLVHLPISLGELESREKALYKERHDAKVLLDRLEAQAGALEPIPAGAPAAAVDVSGLVEQLAQAQRINKAHGERRAALQRLEDIMATRKAAIGEVEESIAQLTHKLEKLRHDQDQDDEIQRGLARDVASLIDVDTTPLQEELKSAAQINEAYQHALRARERSEALTEELGKQQRTWQTLDEKLGELRRQRREMLDRANIPVEGMGISDDGLVTCRGIPVDQCSDGELIDLSVDIGMALNPRLKFMRIKAGSLLDETKRQRIVERAIARGYTVLMEVVAEPGKGTGIVIEEGEIVSHPAEGISAESSMQEANGEGAQGANVQDHALEHDGWHAAADAAA